MKAKVYIETTIVSYLTARPSNDPVVAGRQALTQIWWEEHSRDLQCVVSSIVLEEAREGNAEAAARRIKLLAGIPVVSFPEDALALADDRLQALSAGDPEPSDRIES